jgi:hypothetical protein
MKDPVRFACGLSNLLIVARVIRDSYHTDPGTADLDNEQPIHISTTLGVWRELNSAISALEQGSKT